jgi:hypothetical protein
MISVLAHPASQVLLAISASKIAITHAAVLLDVQYLVRNKSSERVRVR